MASALRACHSGALHALLGIQLALASACGGGGASSDGGDDGGAADTLAVTAAAYSDVTHALTPLADGDSLDLVYPPQGGYVLFAGVRVRGLASSDPVVSLHGELRDPSTMAVVGVETRTVELVADAADATVLESDTRSYTSVSNIPVCPNPSASDRVDAPLLLTLRVTGLSTGRTGAATVRVVLRCHQTDASMLALCQCECRAHGTSCH